MVISGEAGQRVRRVSQSRGARHGSLLHGQSACDLAASLIPESSKRWRHSRSAAEAASEAGQTLSSDECRLLVDAAWVHDIGYHHPDPPTGFHPLDGAQLVLEAGWPQRIAALVAHHSEARFMAAARGVLSALDGWPRETGPVSDALVWADLTAAPAGGRLGIRDRLADIRRRHAREAPQRAAARTLREPHLLLAAARVDLSLVRAGADTRLAFPAARIRRPPSADVGWLASRHPGRCTGDLEAALHACADLNLEDADRLLVGARGGPDQTLAWAMTPLDEVTTNDR